MCDDKRVRTEISLAELEQVLANCFVKSQITVLDFGRPTVPVATTQYCHHGMKRAINNASVNESGYV